VYPVLWIVSLFANGISAATNSTPVSTSPETKFTFLASRSSFAITSFALCFLQAARAAGELGPVASITALDLDKLAQKFPASAVKKVGNGLALRFEAEPALALLYRSKPEGKRPIFHCA
jgi:hypothetical protein